MLQTIAFNHPQLGAAYRTPVLVVLYVDELGLRGDRLQLLALEEPHAFAEERHSFILPRPLLLFILMLLTP